MTDEVIKLEHISKWFYLSGYNTGLTDILSSLMFKKENFFPLADITLNVNKGDSIALIGKNGAGKTLLLKIISGMVCPSAGSVVVTEPVSPIFSYGAGFHPELSGRDNVFLYGSLLGIRKSLIKKYFNEIVDFSEISEFIDMKIKYYSSGMKVRLAFSVISFLEPKILILDEALTPGDASFVRKAHDKISELKQQGVTMIITAHSDDLLREFCNKGIVLDKGEIKYNGSLEDSIKYYRNTIIKQPVQLVTNVF